jgi:hypothetical protein
VKIQGKKNLISVRYAREGLPLNAAGFALLIFKYKSISHTLG